MKKLSLLLIVSILALSSCDWLFNSPVANAGSDKAIFLGESTTLYGSSGLTDESGVAYTWTTTSSSVTLGETNTSTPSFTASAAGTYTIAHSGSKLPPNPDETFQAFRTKVATHSGLKLPLFNFFPEYKKVLIKAS